MLLFEYWKLSIQRHPILLSSAKDFGHKDVPKCIKRCPRQRNWWCQFGFAPNERAWFNNYYLCKNIHCLLTTEIPFQTHQRSLSLWTGVFHRFASPLPHFFKGESFILSVLVYMDNSLDNFEIITYTGANWPLSYTYTNEEFHYILYYNFKYCRIRALLSVNEKKVVCPQKDQFSLASQQLFFFVTKHTHQWTLQW